MPKAPAKMNPASTRKASLPSQLDEWELQRSMKQARAEMKDGQLNVILPLEKNTGESEDDFKRRRKFGRTRRGLKLAQLAAYASGRPDLAEKFGLGAETSNALGQSSGERAAAFRNLGANIAGGQASKRLEKGFNTPNVRIPEKALGKDLPENVAGRTIPSRRIQTSGNTAAAIGGAVAGALAGESASGIAKTAVSWWLLRIGFVALFSLAGFVPGLLYLNFHYVMSKTGSQFFGEMFFWQKIVLAIANILVFIILLISIVLGVMILCYDPVLNFLIKAADFFGFISTNICSNIGK
jgi:hypothetical protein